MKILIYGECDKIGSGAWCYKETLQDLGHQVAFFSPDFYLSDYNKIFWRIFKRISRRVTKFHRRRHVHFLLDVLSNTKFDLFIVLKGLLISKYDILYVKSLGVYTILINHDDIFSKFKNSRSRIQFECLPFYNQVFVTKEINYFELIPFFQNVNFLPFSFYPKIHCVPKFDTKDKIKWGYDILFVGSCYKSRREVLEFCVKNLPLNLRIGIFGNGWNKVSSRSPLKKYIAGKELNFDEMRKAFFYSKISFGFLCKENRDDHTQRTFEIPACGGLLFAEKTERHQNLFIDLESAIFFDIDNLSEIISKIHFLLNDYQMIERIKLNGLKRVFSLNASYEDRIKAVFNVAGF
jgi:spore maturation protein CgeB